MSTARPRKMKSTADLAAWRGRLREKEPAAANAATRQVLVCFGGSCLASGAREVRDALREAIGKAGLGKQVALVETGCMGPCVVGPVVLVGDDRTFYQGVKPGDAAEIVAAHLVGGRRVERLLVTDAAGQTPAPCRHDLPFFKRQTQIVLRNCGWINPERIEDYVARDGYAALARVLTEMKPADVIEQMKQSGLRGRGGAGFPTWMKWNLAAQAASPDGVKYVLCNADEGDPGAYMDRSVLEGDPHSVIEGMVVAAYAVGAQQGYVYVRAEYPLAVERLALAIGQARASGLLGRLILGTDFSFDLEIRKGSGAFVCGEETALMASIEGRRGEPRPRPPFPAQKGLWERPTVLNNVETYANIAPIISKGADWFASIGTEKSKGTKVFAVAGKINNTGLVEVPMGTPLRDIIFKIGGGIPNGKRFKAAQTGGPSGGCLTEQHLDMPMEYDALVAAGSMMGSGGLIVMDEDTCMVDVARFFLDFTQDESCGKCTPCRIGTKRMLEILTRITEGEGKEGDIQALEDLGKNIRLTSLCGLGQSAPNPVLSTIKHFRHEYEAHIRDKKCPSGVCRSLMQYNVISELCKGCGLCARNCPEDAITGEPKKPYVVDQEKCVKCGKCLEKCPFKAIEFK